MGRHGRSAAGRDATGRGTGVTDTRGPATESYGPENLYGYAAVADLPVTPAARSHRKRKTAIPVRAGLLGVSAAVALGTVAVASGVLPGTENYSLGGGSNNSDSVQAVGSPSTHETQQGGTSGSASADGREGTSTSRGSDRSASPSASASAAPATSSAAPTTAPSQEPSTTKPGKTANPNKPATPPGQARKTTAPTTTAPIDVSAQTAAEVEVLKLVNDERAKVGCSPVAANSALSDLAQAFSEDMATRDFFDHTDPSGLSPWDRAAKAGITSLGGENIARGQADAAAVMDAWMNSPGHRANILNCDFKTLGVGVHLGTGGPWWTQDFGY